MNALASYNAQKANAITNAVHSSDIRNSGKIGLYFESKKDPLDTSNPSKFPSLHSQDWDAKSSSKKVAEELAAKILGKDLPTPTPSPAPAPSPQPGPSIPTQTPNLYPINAEYAYVFSQIIPEQIFPSRQNIKRSC